MDTKCDFSAAIASDSVAQDLHSRLIGPSHIALPSAVESLFALYGGRIGGLNGGLILEAVGNVLSPENTRRILSEMESSPPCLPMPCSLTEAIQRAAYTHFKWDQEGLSDVLCAISALVTNPEWFSQSNARLWRLSTEYSEKGADSVDQPVKVRNGIALFLVKAVLQSLAEVRKDDKLLERWMQRLIEELLKRNWKEMGIAVILSVLQDFQSLGWSGDGLKEKLAADMQSFSERDFLDGLWTALTGVIESCGLNSVIKETEQENEKSPNSTLWICVVLTLVDGMRSNDDVDFKKKLLQEVANSLKARFISAPCLIQAILQGMSRPKSHDRHSNKATEIWLLLVMDDFLKDSTWLQWIDKLLKAEFASLRERDDELQSVLFEIDSLNEFHIGQIVSRCCKWIKSPACSDLQTTESIMASSLNHPTKRVIVFKEILGCIQPGCSEGTILAVFSLLRKAFDILTSMSDTAQIKEILCMLDKSLQSVRTCIPPKVHPDLFKIVARISSWDARYPAALFKTILSHQNESERGKTCLLEVEESIVGATEGLLELGLAKSLTQPPEDDVAWMRAFLMDSLRAFSYKVQARLYDAISATLANRNDDIDIDDDDVIIDDEDESYWIVLMVRDLLIDQVEGYIHNEFRMEHLFAGDVGCQIAVPIDLLVGAAIKFAVIEPTGDTTDTDVLKITLDVIRWLGSEDCYNQIVAFERDRKIVAICVLMRLVETLVDRLMCDGRILERISKHVTSVGVSHWDTARILMGEMIVSHGRLWKLLCEEYQDWQDSSKVGDGLSSEEFVLWGDVAGDFLKNVGGCGTEHVATMVRACAFGDLSAGPDFTALSGKGASELLNVFVLLDRHGMSLGLPMLSCVERMVSFVCSRDDIRLEEVELILSRSILLREVVEKKLPQVGPNDKDIFEIHRLGTIFHIASDWLSHVLLSDKEPKSSPEIILRRLFPSLSVKESVRAVFSMMNSTWCSQTKNLAVEKLRNCPIAAILLDVTIKLFKLATFREKKFVPQHIIRGAAKFAENLTSYARLEADVPLLALVLPGVVMSVVVGCELEGKWGFHSKYLPIVSVAMDLMEDSAAFACTVLLAFVSGEIESCPWPWIGRFGFGKDMALEKGFVFCSPARHRLKIVQILFQKLAQGCYFPENNDETPNPAILQMEASIVGSVCCVLIIAEAILGGIKLDESAKNHADVMEFLEIVQTSGNFIADTIKVAKLRWKQLNSLNNTSTETGMGTIATHSELICHMAVLGTSISTRASTIFQHFDMENPCEELPRDMELLATDHSWVASLTAETSTHGALAETIGAILLPNSSKIDGGRRVVRQGDEKSGTGEGLLATNPVQTLMAGKKRKKRAKVVPVTPKQESREKKGVRVVTLKQTPDTMIWRGEDLEAQRNQNQVPVASTPTRQNNGGGQSSSSVLDADSPISLEERFDSPERGAPAVEFVTGQKLMEHSSSEKEKEKNKKRKRLKKRIAETKEKHPYIAAVLQNDRSAGYHDDDDYSDLEDFIVPSKDKDYEKMLKKMHTMPPKE